jgi:5-methylcytosine-specific restriction enzyme A
MLRRRGYAQRSPAAAAYHVWYHTAGWRALRLAQLKREPLCRMCQAVGRSTAANTADHIVPHRGDRALFFNSTNLQSLCDIHHGQKQRIEAGLPARLPVDADGWPDGPRGGESKSERSGSM